MLGGLYSPFIAKTTSYQNNISVLDFAKKHAHISCTCANKTLSLHTYLNIVQ
ncbi:hypothetical protein HMPREF1254_0274 [Prevotella sp. BV3P1]|nr:hypothetical protein HMPREF1254_0274 [Prevotella sp. BV3P1]